MPRTRSTRRTAWTIAAMIALSGSALVPPALAQTPPAAVAPQGPPQPSGADAQKPPDPPVAAVGEEVAKPRRGFFSALTYNLKDDLKHMPRWNSLLVLGTGGALALAAHQRDSEIDGKFVKSSNGMWKPGKLFYQPTILGAGLASYVVGRATSSPRLQHLGMDEIEASLITGAIVLGMKQAIRRDRPLTSDGKPQSGYAFPSGHAAATFAGATVLQQHLGYKAGLPTYLVASYVAMSRLHDRKHFASDVIMGSAIGIMVGRTVTWHGRHFYSSPMLLPTGGGLMVSLKP